MLLYLRKMCCPYFTPAEARTSGEDARHSMLPLGGFWSGSCGAAEPNTHQSEDLMCCNLGYARGRCSRFPNEDGADAVRFTVASDETSSVGLYYVIERDHAPFAHGTLTYSRAAGEFQQLPPGDRLARQAAAYVESYLRRLANGR